MRLPSSAFCTGTNWYRCMRSKGILSKNFGLIWKSVRSRYCRPRCSATAWARASSLNKPSEERSSPSLFSRLSVRARSSLICSWVTMHVAVRISPSRFLLKDVISACPHFKDRQVERDHDPHGEHEQRLDHGRENGEPVLYLLIIQFRHVLMIIPEYGGTSQST